MATAFPTSRYEELTRRAQQRASEQFGLRQQARRTGSMPRSGFSGERDYLNAKNEEAELADLNALLESGGTQLAKTYARYPTTGLSGGALDGLVGARGRTPTPAPASAADDGTNVAYYANQAALEGMQANRDIARTAANEAVFGPDPRRAKAYGDIAREEARRNAIEQAGIYHEPGVQAMLTDQARRRLEGDVGLQREIYRLEGGLEREKERSRGRIGAAEAAGRSGMGREALKGLVRSREMQGLIGGDPAKQAQLERLLEGYAAGGGAGEPTMDDVVGQIRQQAGPDATFYDLLEQFQQSVDWEQLTNEERQQAMRALGGQGFR